MEKALILKIITPRGIVFKDEVRSVTAPSFSGDITILYNHTPLFSLLKEGVVKVRKNEEEYYFSIGGGYLETTGKEVNLLVSRAYGQDEIDEESVKKAKEEAEKLLKESKTEKERRKAMASLRRSFIDLKVLRFKRKKKRVFQELDKE
ncbi:MAG: ATP synthase F1 subunit epsilon [Nitrososphaeria archaeon]